MKGNVLCIAARVAQGVEHALRARVVERVYDDDGIALAIRVRGEPGGDGVARMLVVSLVGEIVLFRQIVVEEDTVVIALGEQARGLCDIAGDIQLPTCKLSLEPCAPHGVVFDDKDSSLLIALHPRPMKYLRRFLLLTLCFFERAFCRFELLSRLAQLALRSQALVFLKVTQRLIQ